MNNKEKRKLYFDLQQENLKFGTSMLPEKLSSQQVKNKVQLSETEQVLDDQGAHKSTIKQIILLGIFFLLLTLTYVSFSTIITYIYEDLQGLGYLGPLLLITNYGTFMIVNIFAPFIKISYKKQLIIGAICYTINYALEIPLILNTFGIFFLVFGSILGGFGAAIVWISQGGFMIALLEKYHRPLDHHGRYFGLLNMIVFSNTLLGSLVTTFGLGFLGDREYFIILTFIGGLSICFSVFLLQDVQKKPQTYLEFKDQEEDRNLKKQNKIRHITQKQQPQRKWLIFSPQMNVMNTLKQIYQFSTKMKNFIPMIITDGCILGFISSSSTHLLPKDHYQKVQVGIFLVFLGLGAIIGGYLSGFFSDKFQIIKVGKSCFLVLGICILLSLPIFMGIIDNVIYANFIGFAWGFGWHYMDGWLWVICSKIFDGKLQAFALNKFIHSFSFVIYQVAVILEGERTPRQFIEYFFCILLVLILFSLISLLRQENNIMMAQSH